MDQLQSLLSEYDVVSAFWMTIKLTFFGAIGALVIGTLVAVMRVSPVRRVPEHSGIAYVTLIRNTPLTLIVFFCAFGLLNTLQIHLAGPELADLVGRQQLPVGCGRARHLPRVVRGRGHPQRHQHRAPGSGRGGPGDRPELPPDRDHHRAAAGVPGRHRAARATR